MSNLDYALQERRTELNRHLRQYLEQNGIDINSSGQMSCWLGTHKDDTPSMRLMKPNHERVICYSCGGSGDIFDAANIIEGKPLQGKGFIVENINYLSKLFGYPPLEIELSPEDERELKAERIYRIGASLFQKRLHTELAKKRGWYNDSACRAFGVGTLNNVDDYIHALMKTANATKQDLDDVCFEHRWFGPNKITFVLRDPRGNCIGFASRNMDYEEVKAKNPSASIQKYLNPLNASPLYRKGNFIYNLDRAKKYKTVVLVEGYAEILTGALMGINNIAAFGAAGTFTEEKIENLLANGVESVVLAAGYDFKVKEVDGVKKQNRAAQNGVSKNLKILQKYPELKVRIFDFTKLLPQYLDKYPEAEKVGFDEYMQTFTKEQIVHLIDNAISSIIFTLEELKETGITNPKDLANKLIDLAAHESDPLEVPEHIKAIAEGTGIDIDFITESVKKKRNLLDEERRVDAHKLLSHFNKQAAHTKSTSDLIDLSLQFTKELEKVDPRKSEFSAESDLKWMEEFENQVWDPESQQFYRTGLHFFDLDMGGIQDGNETQYGGIPKGPGYILFPGDSQAGKSMSVQQITHGLLKHNEDICVAVMASDDGRLGWLQRLWCMESNFEVEKQLALYECRNPLRYLNQQYDQEKINLLKKAQSSIKNYVEEKRLIIRDSSYGTRLSTLRKMVEGHHRKSDKPLVFILDGIHKLSGTTEQKVLDDYSSEIKQMSQEFNMCFLVTAELRKREKEAGYHYLAEPTNEDIKGSRQIEYDADTIYILDNPMRRMKKRPDAKTKKGEDLPCYEDVSNSFWFAEKNNPNSKHMPIIWIHRSKNKLINLQDDYVKYYSKFHGVYMHFEEHKVIENPDSIHMETQ
jgi:archaellum biogenesis ATPase FlaH